MLGHWTLLLWGTLVDPSHWPRGFLFDASTDQRTQAGADATQKSGDLRFIFGWAPTMSLERRRGTTL